MRVFVINLARSPKRRKFIEASLQKLGLAFEFFVAVDANELDDAYIASIGDPARADFLARYMKKGAYGCLLSHQALFQKIVDENLPYATIMEDDVQVAPDFKQLLDKLVPHLNPNEIVLLNSRNDFGETAYSTHAVVPVLGYQLAYPILPWVLQSGAAYVITQQAAQNLLSIISPVRYPLDSWGHYYDEKLLHSIRCVVPYPVTASKFESDINYVGNDGPLGKIRQLIYKYNIVPLRKLIEYRRRNYVRRQSSYTFVDQPSPVTQQSRVA
ncbi:glycosyltransferase family 25 protein [Hymenobacter cellulosilyticus]|uniref:Glycosyltransferase family 25 protein n=1 Tax=Hymenobacter cellulosilyticus TaxID=2932248 RepID=A0A8T9QF08_9BACT|nr:glycosyltransferase family 25 protein [Hymenobacter cellulosilyticus]UOQ73413.1 glycosyltransferase family 25 protein [Hymenobacter cellulosilyticus]